MLNQIFLLLLKKNIILYVKHRNVLPVINNKNNKKKYLFFNINFIWKLIPFKNSNKLKHRIMFFILNVVNPKYIISMNWISTRESLYMVWTKKNSNSKFIVIQHGLYLGGVLTKNISELKYTKCNIFFVWGDFFLRQFYFFNSKKNVKIIPFGNPIYNSFERINFNYKNDNNSNKVLFIPTALNKTDLEYFYILIQRIEQFGIKVYVKNHNKQGNNELNFQNEKKYPEIHNVNQIFGNLYDILKNNDFDFIISDHSSSLLDAIFFKNKVLYYDPNNKVKGYVTHYSHILPNLFDEDFTSLSKERLYELLSIEKQEKLLDSMIFKGNNIIDI